MGRCRADGSPALRAATAWLAVLAAIGAIGAITSPVHASSPKHCVGAEEARVAGEDEGPPRFSAAFYRHAITLEASLDGADGTELPISIEQVCDVPRKLAKQARQLAGADGVALLLTRTTVTQDGEVVSGDDVAAAIDGADTAALRVRLLHPPSWREDEDGNAIPTFRAGRVEITD
jgi:hypothetical protein